MSRFFRDASDSSSSESEEELLSSDDNAPAKPAQTQQKQPMSRFLKTAGDSSSSSSSSSSSDEEESDDGNDTRPAPAARKTMADFRKTANARDDDESDSDDAPKTVKSAKDKKIEGMQTIGKAVDNAVKIADWVATSNEFEKLAKLVQKPTNVTEPVPPHWLRAIVSIEAALAATKDKDPKKKINANVARAMNGLKQRIKKVAKEYEEPIKKFNEDPEKFEKEYLLALEPPPVAPRQPRPVVDGDTTVADDPDQFTTVGKGGKGVQHTSETIFKDLAQVNENRGKKNTDRVEQVRTLEKLLAVAITTYQRIRVLLALIAARFDYNPAAAHMPRDAWMSVQEELDQLVRLLIREPSYSVDEAVDFEYDEMVERSPETVKTDKEGREDGIVRIRGSIISFVDRLDDEFTRSLQNIDPHGTEYIERLRDEQGLYKAICLAESFFERTSRDDARARVIMRRLEHIYYKPDAVVEALEQILGADAANRPVLSLQSAGNPQGLVHSICILLYKTSNPILRTRAMLCHIYNHALHNDFYTARDMILMSHLQESVHSADVSTQILYNRTIVQ
ncbi:Translation initiation factor 3 subunit c, partial [Serendipita sp. 398]